MAFASSAQAGITIPAGDWTVDIGGNVNAYYTNVQTTNSFSGAGTINGNSGYFSTTSNPADSNTIGTGLLPAAFGIGAKTRQNDLDIAFQFSFFTGTSAGTGAAGGGNTLNIRQAFLTFGDASWGTIKGGRDLGIFGSDAILSDMTLLGVGVGGPAGGSSTLGRIGSGYVYADWKGQISYTSPNWNGFQVAAGVMEPFTNGVTGATREDMGYEGKATYDFAANDVTGRVWVSGITQKHATGIDGSYTSRAVDIGAKVAYQGFGLVGYYYDGRGIDSQFRNLTGSVGGLQMGNGLKSDDNGGYVQATFVIPGVGTKLGASYGRSESDYSNYGDSLKIENESFIVGAYHPLTKSLNLVAEYTMQEIKGSASGAGNISGYNVAGVVNGKQENDTLSLGAILFF
jgi:predicted porin